MSERKELIVTGMCTKVPLVAGGLMPSTLPACLPDCVVRIATHLRRFAPVLFPKWRSGTDVY